MKKIVVSVLSLILAAVLVGCSEKPKDVNLKNVMSEIESTVSLDNMADLSMEDLLDYYGIVENDVVQFVAKVNTSGIKSDEIVIIQAKDSDATARVKEKLDARYQSKINENTNYNIDELAVVEKGKVSVNGDYVSMIVSSEVDKITEIYNNAFK